ncbi:MAG: CPBP family intramembrane glutamic endopeptidase [Opitutaceae bacterium]
MPSSAFIAVGTVELTLIVVGCVLLWQHALSPAARSALRPASLPPWDIRLEEFLTFTLLVLGGSFFLAIVAAPLARSSGLAGDAVTIVTGAAAQLGMLGGVLLSAVVRRAHNSEKGHGFATVFWSGAATFAIALPVLVVTAKLSEFLVRAAGLPVDKQDLIGMFARADTPWLLAMLIGLAVLVAPLTEELVFRAGVFRYLRTRIPRALALVLPALFFAALHVNWKTLSGLASLPPLLVLAVIFSLAYERTGRIGTPIVAHALFNLNTVLVVLSGIDR